VTVLEPQQRSLDLVLQSGDVEERIAGRIYAMMRCNSAQSRMSIGECTDAWKIAHFGVVSSYSRYKNPLIRI
jgi:hypothetical protein